MPQPSLNRLGRTCARGTTTPTLFARAKASLGGFRRELWRGLQREVRQFRERVESERLSGRRRCQELKNPGPVSGRVLQLFVVCSTPMPERYAISVAR